MRPVIAVTAAAVITAATVATAGTASAASGSSISGTITDTHGRAIIGAAVGLLRSDTANGTFTSSGSPTKTDKKGHYSFATTDGFYRVTADKKDCYAPNSYSSASHTVTRTTTSEVQQVPPSVNDLNLTMDCTNLHPAASFTAPALVKFGDSVTLDASGSQDPNGTVSAYIWDFGDGTHQTTSSPSVTHVYPVIATFAPKLVVRDDQGATSSTFTGGPIGVGTVPGQLTNLAATTTPNTANSITLNWSAPAANSSAITAYTVKNETTGRVITTNRTTAEINGLAGNTSYTFTVHATNGFGDSAAGTTSGYTDASTSMPTLLITHAPVGYTNQSSGTIAFTITPATGTSITSTSCSLDGGAPSDCHQQPYTFSGLQPGSHTVVVSTTDSNGNRAATSTQWVVDTTAPSAALLTPTTATSLSRGIGVMWGGTDANGVASYDVRYTKASWNGKLGRQTTWEAAATRTAATFKGGLGSEYCFSARSRDGAGNVSGWTARRCTALPLDDRSLAASGGWTKLSSKSFYAGTALRSSAKGATLTRTGAVPGRAGLVVARGKGYGSIAVLYNGKTVKTISLSARSTQREVVITLPRVTKAKTTITVRVTSTKKPVVLDGLLLARV